MENYYSSDSSTPRTAIAIRSCLDALIQNREIPHEMSDWGRIGLKRPERGREPKPELRSLLFMFVVPFHLLGFWAASWRLNAVVTREIHT